MIKNRAAALALATAFSIAAMPATSAPKPKGVSAVKVVKNAEEPGDIFTLIMACKTGDIDEVRHQLSLNVDPQGEDNQALADAVFGGYYEIAELLLEKGADPNAHNKRFIMLAAMRGHNDIIGLLLKHKVSVTGNGNQPLAQAAVNGHLDTIDFLLDNPIEKADINGNHGWALASAMDRGAVESVKHLLARGANSHAGSVQSVYLILKNDSAKMMDPAYKEIIGRIDADRAAHPASSEPVPAEPQFEEQEKKPEQVLTAQETSDRNLIIGVNNDDLGMVRKALEQGADPDAKGGIALYTATMNNNIPLMTLLLEKDANPDLQDGWILAEALENANSEAVKLLLKHDADPFLDGVNMFLKNYADIMEKETPLTSPRHFDQTMKDVVALITAARANLQAEHQQELETPKENAPLLAPDYY